MTRSPHRLKEQVRGAVSELPIHAARLAVMGVGRALLLTDRVRKDYREARQAGLGPVLGRLRDDAENLSGKVIGRVTSLPRPTHPGRPAEPPATDSEIVVGKPEPRPQAAEPVPRPRIEPDAAPSESEAPAELPVPGYDQASIASVRARLRGLDADQVAALRNYERAHAARAEFLRMFENRIAKLESGG
jgi:hypothetical protein